MIDFSDFNRIDIVLLVILLIGIVNGARLGFVQALSNMVGWAIALILAVKFYDDIAPLWTWATDKIWYQNILAFSSIIIAIMMMTWGLIFLLDSTFKKLKITPLNRLAGAIFGVAKSSLIVLVLLNTLTPIFGKSDMWKSSHIIPILYPYAPMAIRWSKQKAINLKQRVEDYIESDDVLPKSKKQKSSTSSHSSSQSSQKSSSREVKNPFSS